MQHLRPLWIAFLLLCAATAAAGPGRTPEQALVAADTARMEAMVAGDFAALERVLGDDLSYGHSTGQVQGKHDFLEDLRSGARRYRAMTAVETSARAYGCAGVVTGTTSVEVEAKGRPLALTLRYTATYARQHGRWVLVAYQSARLPDAATPR